MKKIVLVFFTVLLVSFCSHSYAQRKVIKRGFSIFLSSGITSPRFYGVPNLDPDLKYGFITGFGIGNRWYIKPNEKFGFGIMVNWLDVSYARGNVIPKKEMGNNKTEIINFSALAIGPIGTLALTQKTGLDLYYNLKPTYMNASIYLDEIYDTSDFQGLGLTHNLGCAIRYKALSVNIEFHLGSLKSLEKIIGDKISQGTGATVKGEGPERANSSQIRMLIGFKF